jgi:hypothetical protein
MPRRLKFHVPVPPLGQHLSPRLLRPVAWRPLTDGEWDFVRPFLRRCTDGGGRWRRAAAVGCVPPWGVYERTVEGVAR